VEEGKDSTIYAYCLTLTPPATRGLIGVDGRVAVYSLSAGEVAAVVSRVSKEEFSEQLLEGKVRDLAWLAEKVRLHETVVEEVMAQTTVLPLRLMTLFSAEDRLLEALRPHQNSLKAFLEETQDKAEWAVKVYLDTNQAMNCLLSDSPKADPEPPQAPGEIYLFQKHLQKRAREELAEARARLCQELYHGLADLSASSKRLKPLEGEGSIVFNAAFLVSRDGLEAFHREVDRLAGDYHKRGFLLHLSGPWPPYNFCPVLQGCHDPTPGG
jgi:hypothetical protein